MRAPVHVTGGWRDGAALAHIFEPFHQTQPPRGPRPDELGLAIVKRYVDPPGGEIRVRSVVESGSCCQIELPGRPAAAASAAQRYAA